MLPLYKLVTCLKYSGPVFVYSPPLPHTHTYPPKNKPKECNLWQLFFWIRYVNSRFKTSIWVTAVSQVEVSAFSFTDLLSKSKVTTSMFLAIDVNGLWNQFSLLFTRSFLEWSCRAEYSAIQSTLWPAKVHWFRKQLSFQTIFQPSR